MKLRLLLLTISFSFFLSAFAQKKPAEEIGSDDQSRISPVTELKATPVKNQSATGTCWCFATTSFIESELLRMGKGEYDLSEMFVVRQNYLNKLTDNYLRLGKGNLGEGSLSHHWMTVFSEQGIVPEEVYAGLNYGSPTHNHDELNSFISAVAAVPVEKKSESKEYNKIVSSILDIYLGLVPESFSYKGKQYTPGSFAGELGIKATDYVEITSFTHFPYYTKGQLEIPDNWDHSTFYNVPVDELVEIIDYSVKNGYTVNWDGDVSESGFNHEAGTATVTDSYVTQEMRQAGYENFTTTDDHLMHLTGISEDENGGKYYIIKNSWGTTGSNKTGYLNMSEQYLRAKTIFIMVNINSIPPAIKDKLGIK